ncbi:MAG: MerR family DNA-binding transcriptional regulator [Solirubrobacteraceae bacterium]
MAMLTIGEAAAIVHTSPNTIRSWEQRYGYPMSVRSSSGRRLYDEAEIGLLGDALRRGLRISCAIRHVRQETGSYKALLQEALSKLDVGASDALLEAAIALRGASRAFDEIVLAAVEGLVAAGHDSGVIALAVAWTHDRACWSRRQTATAVSHTVVMVDGSAEGTVTRAASCILELQLALRSMRVHPLRGPATGTVGSVARKVGARAIVFVGPLPPSAYRHPSSVPAHLNGCRTEAALPPTIELLPSQPRLAAEDLLAACSDDAAHVMAWQAVEAGSTAQRRCM